MFKIKITSIQCHNIILGTIILENLLVHVDIREKITNEFQIN